MKKKVLHLPISTGIWRYKENRIKTFINKDKLLKYFLHKDIGQMQMYVNYYKKTQMIDGENEYELAQDNERK